MSSTVGSEDVVYVESLDDVKRMLNIMTNKNIVMTTIICNNKHLVSCHLKELLAISKTDKTSFGKFRRTAAWLGFEQLENIRISSGKPIIIELKNKVFEV